MSAAAKTLRTPAGWLMVLTEGDDLFAQLTALALREDIPSASLTGFGFAGKVTFGYFDFEKRDYDPASFDPNADLLPLVSDLQLLALVGIVDPPRAEARDAITQAHAAGIQVRMITGDHAITAEAIARQLGIRGQAITGAEFSALSDDEADRRIDDIGVIARVAPEDKVRLVDILRRKGHIVAMTGDGVNDAPALKSADIGVAMGITGTEVS